MGCKSHFNFVSTQDLPSRNPKKISMIAIKEIASQEVRFLTTDRCLPQQPLSSLEEPHRRTRERTGCSYLRVHRRLRTWLFHCPARVCSCAHPERERAEVCNDVDSTRPCREVGERSREAMSTDTGILQSGERARTVRKPPLMLESLPGAHPSSKTGHGSLMLWCSVLEQ